MGKLACGGLSKAEADGDRAPAKADCRLGGGVNIGDAYLGGEKQKARRGAANKGPLPCRRLHARAQAAHRALFRNL